MRSRWMLMVKLAAAAMVFAGCSRSVMRNTTVVHNDTPTVAPGAVNPGQAQASQELIALEVG